MNIAPVEFQWDGEVMRPARHYLPRCHKQYVVGETYPMIPHEDRSTNSHNHFFAAVHEAWKNLPEKMTARFPTSEHLRKWALIKAGYADERSIACDTADEALKIASFIKPMDDFAVLVVADATIKVFTAKSQSARAMDKKDFQESKQAVLDIVAEMIGVDAATLSANTQSSAPADAGAEQVERTAPPHSPEAPSAPQPSPQVKPAPATDEESAKGAGISQSSAVAIGTAPPAAEERQATEPVASALHGSGGLPEGWEREYAKALAKATKPHSLSKYATAWWAPYGGWIAHKSGPNAGTAQAIYDAYADHFGDAGKEARETILHELGAL